MVARSLDYSSFSTKGNSGGRPFGCQDDCSLRRAFCGHSAEWTRSPNLEPSTLNPTWLLGGPWDLVTTYDWAYNRTCNRSKWAYRGHLKKR